MMVRTKLKLIRSICCVSVLVAATVLYGIDATHAGLAQQTSIIVQAGSATVEPGGTVVVPVTIDAGSNLIGAMTMAVNYNAAELTISNCTKVSSLISFCNAGTAGNVIWTGADPSGISGTVTLVELTIEAGNLPANTVSNLEIEVITLADINGTLYTSPTLTNGQITVSPATATPTDTPTTIPSTNTPTIVPTGTSTIVPTVAPTEPSTSTPQPTDTPTTVPSTNTPTVAPTDTLQPTNTPVSTNAPTGTLVPNNTVTPTVGSTNTPTPVATATATATASPISVTPTPVTPTPVTPTAVATPAGLRLNAQKNEGKVDLTWTFEADRQTQWFRIYRSTTADFEEAEEVTTNFIPANITGTKEYEFQDSSDLPSGTYYYWIEQVIAGTPTKQHGPVNVVISNATAGQDALYLPIINRN